MRQPRQSSYEADAETIEEQYEQPQRQPVVIAEVDSPPNLSQLEMSSIMFIPQDGKDQHADINDRIFFNERH